MNARFFWPSAVAAALLLGACGDEDRSPSAAKHAEEEHGHEKGPHGGAVVVLGEEEAHLEVIHDDGAGRVTIHVLDKDLKALPIPVAQPPVLNVTVAGAPKQLTGVAAAGADAVKGASEWRFEDDSLKSEPEGARFRVVVVGKTFTPDFAHAH